MTALLAHRRSERGALVLSPRFEGGDLHDYKFSEGLAAVKLEGR